MSVELVNTNIMVDSWGMGTVVKEQFLLHHFWSKGTVFNSSSHVRNCSCVHLGLVFLSRGTVPLLGFDDSSDVRNSSFAQSAQSKN